jgi:hypothetical protein
MKRATRPITISVVLMFVICMLITFIMCCTSTTQKQETYWNAQIGVATYNDVVTRLGPPTSKEALSDKSVVAKWERTSWGSSRADMSSDSWTYEIIMRFSPDGILTHSTLNQY